MAEENTYGMPKCPECGATKYACVCPQFVPAAVRLTGEDAEDAQYDRIRQERDDYKVAADELRSALEESLFDDHHNNRIEGLRAASRIVARTYDAYVARHEKVEPSLENLLGCEDAVISLAKTFVKFIEEGE